MDEKFEVYKVVRRYYLGGHLLISALINPSSRYVLYYGLNHRTDPSIGCIYVFRELKHAVTFARLQKEFVWPNRNYEILRCKSSLPKAQDRVAMCTAELLLDRFWDPDDLRSRLLPFGHPVEAPLGTFGVDWVEPVERVKGWRQ